MINKKDFSMFASKEDEMIFKTRKKLYNILWSIDPDTTMKDIIKKAGADCCLQHIIPFVNDITVYSFRCSKCKQIFEFSKKKWSIAD